VRELTALNVSPTSHSGTRPKSQLWKWSLALTAIVLGFLMWQCGSALRQGRVLADPAVEDFHRQLNAGQYEKIYLDADESFTGEGKHDELVKFLEAVHTKLGNAGATNQANMLVNATTSGTFIVVHYNTTFARGSAVETFTFKKSNGFLKLQGYHIESNALIVN